MMKLPLKAMTYRELLALQSQIEAALATRAAAAKPKTKSRRAVAKPRRRAAKSSRAASSAA